MERQRSLYISKVKGQISRSLGLYNEFWHLDPCGQDIARTILSGLFKLGMYTSFEKRKKPIYFARSKVKFQGQWTSIELLVHGSVWAGYSKNYAVAVLELSMYTSYGKRKKPIYFWESWESYRVFLLLSTALSDLVPHHILDVLQPSISLFEKFSKILHMYSYLIGNLFS